MSKKSKEFFTLPKTLLGLIIMIGFTVLAHVNFFLNDMRPFVDHDAHYLFTKGFDLFFFLYDLTFTILNKFSPLIIYNGFFIYKMLNLVYFIPMIVFTYLTASIIYNRGVGLLAAFFVMTYPDVLMAFRKSEINFMLISCFSMCLYFYIKSCFLEKFSYSLLFCMSLLFFAWHHYSFVVYFNTFLPIGFLIFIYRRKKEKKLNWKYISLLCLVVCWLEASLIFVFYWTPSGLLCTLFPMFGLIVLFKMIENKRVSGWLTFLIAIVFLGATVFFINIFSNELLYAVGVVKIKFQDVLSNESSRYQIWSRFFNTYIEKIGVFYRPSVFVVDFTFFSSLICFSFFTVYLLVQAFRKKYLTLIFLQESFLIGFFLLGLMLFSFNIGSVDKFFVPYLIAMAVLNAGFFHKVYCLGKEILWVKVFLFIYCLLLLMVCIFSLLSPISLVKGADTRHDFYCYINDDYNANQLFDFFSNSHEPINLEQTIFINEYEKLPVINIFFYLWIQENKKLRNLSRVVKQRKTEYICVFYRPDYDKAADLSEINNIIKNNLKQDISLRAVIPYGSKRVRKEEVLGWNQIRNSEFFIGDRSDFIFDRDLLGFVYKRNY